MSFEKMPELTSNESTLLINFIAFSDRNQMAFVNSNDIFANTREFGIRPIMLRATLDNLCKKSLLVMTTDSGPYGVTYYYEINPDYAEAENNLGFTLLQAGRVSEAIDCFQRALELQKTPQAYYNLAYALRRDGKAAEAIASYLNCIELKPQFIPAQVDLAWILATWPDKSVRNGNKAVALAEQANRLSGSQSAQVLRVLAAAYAETGHFSEALTTAKQALLLATAQSKQKLAEEIQIEMMLYQANTPCRSTNN